MVTREVVFKDYSTSGLENFEVIVAPTSKGGFVVLANFDKLPEELTGYQAEQVAHMLLRAEREIVPF